VYVERIRMSDDESGSNDGGSGSGSGSNDNDNESNARVAVSDGWMCASENEGVRCYDAVTQEQTVVQMGAGRTPARCCRTSRARPAGGAPGT